MINIFDKLISFGTLILAATTILVIISASMDKQSPVVQLTKKHSALIIFIITFLAMCISLVYSNFFGYTPCYLCWFQRIFIYPSVLFSGIAMYKKDNHVVSYIESLSWVGLVFSIYHNITYYTGVSPLPCDINASCTLHYVTEFGFVTIPFMALVSFIAIITVARIYKSK